MITLKSTFRGDQFLFAPAEEVDFYLAKSKEEPTYHLREESEVADIEDTTLEALQADDISEERGFVLDARDRLRDDL